MTEANKKYIRSHGIKIASEFTPEKYGRLTSIGPVFVAGKNSRQVFECDCGSVIVTNVSSVKRGLTTSCGCYQKEVTAASNTKHGLWDHQLYKTWAAMIQRCCNPNHEYYINYGARGITVCDRWREDFLNFLNDMGERPTPDHSIDRIDNSRGYEPGNCRWATREEQCNNTRSNRFLTFNGETQTVAQWARELGMAVHTIHKRLRLGWPVEKALSEQVRPKTKKAKQ